ncbi:MAG: RNA-dependent DNA polymerase [Chloroflexi bacterium]|nr:RNA-dependent DNA polymerase [Chloroflexota bacterium]
MPKTFKHLYPQVYAFENLYKAFRKARLGGKRKKERVAAFELDLEENLWQLHDELRDQVYQPGPYHNFYVQERKRRLISAAPFRDRVVHHALCNIIQPIFEHRFIYDSYACRKGKGTHRALDRAQEFARRRKYVLQCDVQQFFPSIDHQILRSFLARHIADDKVLWLIDLILASSVGIQSGEYQMHWFPGDDLLAANRHRGLPIGNLTSQHWANVYLDRLDHFVKEDLHCHCYLRYCDDFLLFHNSKAQLWAWRDAVIAFASTLRLRLHEERAVVFPTRTGITWLGFRVFPHYRLLRKDNAKNFARRLHRMREGYQAGRIDAEQVRISIQSWIAHANHGNTYHLRQRIFSGVIFSRSHGGK